MLTAARQVNQPTARTNLPAATIKKNHLSLLLWLIPAGALALCAWFIYHDFISSGPVITIYFQNGEGLEDQEIGVRYRGATIGAVKSVELAPDAQHVKVRARLSAFAANLARDGSRFWIVRPEFSVGAISGLRTIISGDYITLEPGSGPRTNVFVGDEKAPLAEEPGALQITLLADEVNSLQEQSPIFYRGVPVGEILYFQLAPDAHKVAFQARINQQYAPLVRADSKFWNAGGLDVHFGLFKGMQISAESPKTLFSGGVEFATPSEPGPTVTDGAVFFLSDKPDEKWKTWAPTIQLQLTPKAETSNAPIESYLKMK